MPKKTRATKVTDRNKAWNKKPKTSSYRTDTIPINRTILIVCEGQTEKLYFESFPVLALNVKVVDLKGQSKLNMPLLAPSIIEAIIMMNSAQDLE